MSKVLSSVNGLLIKYFTPRLFLLLLSFTLFGFMVRCTEKQEKKAVMQKVIKPPVADQYPHFYTIHGKKVQDNYYWLRDKENPEVIAYLKAENAYTDSIMSGTENLQQRLFEELKGRIQEDDSTVPVQRGDYYYYTRTEKDKQYPIYCRKKGALDAEEEIVLNVNDLAEGQPYFALGSIEISPNHQLLAYTSDTVGNENYSLFIKNLSTRELMESPIPGLSYAVAWANDNQTIFYTTRDEAYRPYKLFLHKIGSNFMEDKLVYHEEDDRFFLSIAKSKDKQYLLVNLRSKTSSEVRYIDANKPNGGFKVFASRVPHVKYRVFPHGEVFYVLTNQDAVNYRLMKASVHATAMNHWQEVVPEQEEITLENIEEFEQYLALFKRVEGLRQIEVFPLDGSASYTLDFEDPAYSLIEMENPNFLSNKLRFAYTSLVQPRKVIAYDMENKSREVLKTFKVLGGFDPHDFVSERIFAQAADGKKIPISLVYKKGLEKDGNNPLYLYGYGAYGITTDPAFNPNRLSLLNRGFVFAIAHIRGSGDMGEQWYLDGKLMNKKNSFTDFIACAEHLIAQKYTNPQQLVAMGGSAGGLLMGAVANMRPDLFNVIVAKVPFVDVINTMLDETLPLTVTEYEEWGNPNKKQYYDYISSYSPYENVKAQAYPNMLITAGLNDPRVSYWEPAKWTAKLRATKTDDNRLLLQTNMEAGHGGASGRHDYLKEVAFEYAFILDVLKHPAPSVKQEPLQAGKYK